MSDDTTAETVDFDEEELLRPRSTPTDPPPPRLWPHDRTTYVYAIPPIDFWTGGRHGETVYDGSLIASAIADVERAELGWKGDFRAGSGPVLFSIPGDGEFLHGVAWKQDGAGATFVWSPISLPHLLDIAFEFAVVSGQGRRVTKEFKG